VTGIATAAVITGVPKTSAVEIPVTGAVTDPPITGVPIDSSELIEIADIGAVPTEVVAVPIASSEGIPAGVGVDTPPEAAVVPIASALLIAEAAIEASPGTVEALPRASWVGIPIGATEAVERTRGAPRASCDVIPVTPATVNAPGVIDGSFTTSAEAILAGDSTVAPEGALTAVPIASVELLPVADTEVDPPVVDTPIASDEAIPVTEKEISPVA